MLEFVGPLKVMDDKVGPVGVKATEKAKGFAAYFRRVAVSPRPPFDATRF